jgi:hypothetical protein
MKTCTVCKETKELDQFQKRSHTGRHRTECKTCRDAYNNTRRAKIAASPKLAVDYKLCPCCNTTKNASEFGKDKAKLDGLSPVCKICRKPQSKKYYEKHKDVILPKQKVYHEKNRDKQLKTQKLYRINNAEEISLKKSVKSKTPEYKAKQNKYTKHRKATDPFFKWKKLIRGSVGSALHAYKKHGTMSCVKDLGCDIATFDKHIADQYTAGMTKYLHGRGRGKIHLDHIIPLDFLKGKETDEEAHLVVLNYRNYRPLWWNENQAKKNNMPQNWKSLYDTILKELKKDLTKKQK